MRTRAQYATVSCIYPSYLIDDFHRYLILRFDHAGLHAVLLPECYAPPIDAGALATLPDSNSVNQIFNLSVVSWRLKLTMRSCWATVLREERYVL